MKCYYFNGNYYIDPFRYFSLFLLSILALLFTANTQYFIISIEFSIVSCTAGKLLIDNGPCEMRTKVILETRD